MKKMLTAILFVIIALSVYGSRSFYDGSVRYLHKVSATEDIGPQYTVATWAMLTNASGQFRWSMLLSGASGYYIGFVTRVSSYAIYGQEGEAASERIVNCNTTMTDGVWYHLAMVRRSTNELVVFVNGIPKGTNTTARTETFGWRTNLAIGGYVAVPASQAWTGLCAEVAGWNVVLDAGELVALASGIAPISVRPSNLKFYVPVRGSSPETSVVGPALNLTNSPPEAPHPRIYR